MFGADQLARSHQGTQVWRIVKSLATSAAKHHGLTAREFFTGSTALDLPDSQDNRGDTPSQVKRWRSFFEAQFPAMEFVRARENVAITDKAVAEMFRTQGTLRFIGRAPQAVPVSPSIAARREATIACASGQRLSTTPVKGRVTKQQLESIQREFDSPGIANSSHLHVSPATVSTPVVVQNVACVPQNLLANPITIAETADLPAREVHETINNIDGDISNASGGDNLRISNVELLDVGTPAQSTGLGCQLGEAIMVPTAVATTIVASEPANAINNNNNDGVDARMIEAERMRALVLQRHVDELVGREEEQRLREDAELGIDFDKFILDEKSALSSNNPEGAETVRMRRAGFTNDVIRGVFAPGEAQQFTALQEWVDSRENLERLHVRIGSGEGLVRGQFLNPNKSKLFRFTPQFLAKQGLCKVSSVICGVFDIYLLYVVYD